MKLLIVLAMSLLLILTGCKEEIPKPESFNLISKAEAATEKKNISVKHVVQGKQVYVECIVPDVTFSNNNAGKRKGKIVVTVDGKRYQEYRTAAFIIKGMNKGIHHLKVEVHDLSNKSLGISKQFYITIP
jgi:hypothetical protein